MPPIYSLAGQWPQNWTKPQKAGHLRDSECCRLNKGSGVRGPLVREPPPSPNQQRWRGSTTSLLYPYSSHSLFTSATLLTLKSPFPFLLISVSLFFWNWAPSSFMSLSLSQGSMCGGSGLGRCRASERYWKQEKEGADGGPLSVCHPALYH